MFPVGSDAMYPHTRQLLGRGGRAIAGTAEPALDARPHRFAALRRRAPADDNWRLSADRANATRLALVAAGLDPARVAEVVGRADAEPLLPDRPDDPRNRRISIVLLRGTGGEPAGQPGTTSRGARGRLTAGRGAA